MINFQSTEPSTKTLKINLRTFFMIDGIGAIISAVMLGTVLVKFQNYIGMPVNSLYSLAFIPVLFFAYDLVFLFAPFRKTVHLRIIAIANLLYVMLSLTLVIFHFGQLTALGLTYFIGEILIVVFLARWELRSAQKL